MYLFFDFSYIDIYSFRIYIILLFFFPIISQFIYYFCFASNVDNALSCSTCGKVGEKYSIDNTELYLQWEEKVSGDI